MDWSSDEAERRERKRKNRVQYIAQEKHFSKTIDGGNKRG